MIAVDTNILVYAHRRDSEWHEPAARRVRELAESGRPWAIPWHCLHEFLAVVTHPQIYRPPSERAEAIAQVEAWLEAPTLTLLAETTGHWSELRDVLVSARVAGPRVYDARIAALCRQHGIERLWSADRDFSRFAGVRVTNPLVGE
jgi:toxin-antitoxin system PIN domain toxin